MTEGKLFDFIGAKAKDIYSDMPEIVEDFNRCFIEKSVIKRQTPFIFKTNGVEKHLDVTCVFVPPDILMVHYRDITAQKRAEESLRKSEERFQLASYATNDALWDWDLTNDSIWYSDACYKLLGCAPEKGASTIQRWRDAIHPDDRERVAKNSDTIIESKENYWMDEYRLCSADGSCAYIFDRGYIVYDDDNKPVRMIGAAVNITERKLAETALHFQKTLLESQSEASIDGILVVTPSGEVLSHNRRFREIWEIPDDVIFTNSDNSFIESVLDKLVEPEEFLETVSYLYEHPFVKDQCEIALKDGRVIERYAAPVIDADNTHFGRVCFFRDITKRKQVESAIRFQAHLLDTVEQAVIATDLEGIITYWNRFAQELHGWSADEAVGRNIMDLTLAEMPPENTTEIMSQLTLGRAWTGEFLVRHKNGTTFPSQMFSSPVNDETGNLIGIVGISNDISAIKQAQNELTEANERAIREYDRLLQRLNTLAQTVGTARELPPIFSAILEFANASVPCIGLFISLYDEDKRGRKIIYMWYNGKERSLYRILSLCRLEKARSDRQLTPEK